MNNKHAIVLSVLCAFGFSQPAIGEVIYSYTGLPFVSVVDSAQVAGQYSGISRITAEIRLENELKGGEIVNATLTNGALTNGGSNNLKSFSISDGRQSIDSRTVGGDWSGGVSLLGLLGGENGIGYWQIVVERTDFRSLLRTSLFPGGGEDSAQMSVVTSDTAYIDRGMSFNRSQNWKAGAQTLFLEFAQELISIPKGLLNTVSREVAQYVKKAANLAPEVIGQVVARVQDIFSAFNIHVTSTKPVTGEYSTVYVGGSKLDMGQKYVGRLKDPGVVGIAEAVDFGNTNRNDSAVVFTEDLTDLSAERISQVIAHEAGHILGLSHVAPTSELMFPEVDPARTLISDVDVRYAGFNNNRELVTGGCTNSFQELGNIVGLHSGTAEARAEYCGRLSQTLLSWGLGGLFGTIYGAQLAVFVDHDAGPTLFDLGDLKNDESLVLNLPLNEGVRLLLFGSSKAGGPVDIVSSPIAFLPSGELVDDELAAPVITEGILSLDLYEVSPLLALIPIGEISISEVGAAIPISSSLTLVLLGLAGVVTTRRLCGTLRS